MKFETSMQVDDTDLDALRSLYDRAFDDLRTRAAQRHALTHDEFDAVLADTRVSKHVVRDVERGGRPCGISTITNELVSMPLISPEFYRARWPELYLSGRIWYIGFLGVDPDYHGTGVLGQLIGSMSQVIPEEGGVVAADICQFNEDALHLPEVFARLVGTFIPGPALRRLDTQTYWAYEFGTPA